MADQAQSNGIGVELDGEFRTPESAIATGIGVEIDGGFHTPGSAICTGIGIELDVVPPFPTGAAVKGVVNAREAIVGEASPPTRMDVKVGNSADLLSAEVPFDALVCEVIVLVEANDFEMLFVDEWGNDGPLFTVRKGTSRSFTAEVRGFKHRNKVAGQVAGYEIIGLYHHYPDVTWPKEMLSSYMGLHSHATLTDVAKLELLARLQPGGYLYNTFGPPGTNETVCDFLFLFTFDGNLSSRVMAKAGAVLRWDVDGTVYNQNDWPVHAIDPAKPNVITVSTTDGWGGLTLFYCYTNHLTGMVPSVAACVNLIRFFCYNNKLTGALPSLAACVNLLRFSGFNNAFTGALPSFAACVNLTHIYCYTNNFAGALPSFAACANLTHCLINDNGFTGALPPFATCADLAYFYGDSNGFIAYTNEAMQVFRVVHTVRINSFNQPSIDNFLIDYEAIKTPMALSGNNYSINLSGVGNAPPSVVGIAARDAIIAEFTSTPGSGTLTITHN